VLLMSLDENDAVVAKIGDFGLSLSSSTVQAANQSTPENPSKSRVPLFDSQNMNDSSPKQFGCLQRC